MPIRLLSERDAIALPGFGPAGAVTATNRIESTANGINIVTPTGTVALTASGVTVTVGGTAFAVSASGVAVTGSALTFNGAQVETV